MWRRGRRCRATASACASRARGRRCSAAAPQRHVTCRVSVSGLKKRRSVLKVGLFSLSSFLFFLSSSPLISERAGSQEQRKDDKRPNALPALLLHPFSSGKRTILISCLLPPSLSSLSRPLAGSSGTCHTSPLPPETFPFQSRLLIPGGVSGLGPEVYTIRISEFLRE